jgi:hypothetical protein
VKLPSEKEVELDVFLTVPCIWSQTLPNSLPSFVKQKKVIFSSSYEQDSNFNSKMLVGNSEETSHVLNLCIKRK